MEKNREQIFNTVAQTAKKIGVFLFGSMEAPAHMSNHYRGAEEMLSSIEPTPVQPELPFSAEKEEVARLVEQAKRAKNIPAYDSLGTYIEDYEV
jgi:hypothetical protein